MAMAQLSIQHLSFRYPNDSHLSLSNITFTVQQGEWIVICGPSGSGKSTLLRQLKRELRPAGDRSGQILYNGILLDHYPLSELAKDIGMVMQDPEQQNVVDDCMHELVFGLENLGFKTEEMHRRAAEVISLFGMDNWIHKRVHELSGGQKQTLNLASIIMAEPKILLLDEPTAQLDPVAAKEFLQHIRRLNEELGMTIIMVEHRLDEVMAMSDQIMLMDEGELEWSGPVKSTIHALWSKGSEKQELQSYVPSIPLLYLKCQESMMANEGELASERSASEQAGWIDQLPLTVREGKEWVRKHEIQFKMSKFGSHGFEVEENKPLLQCKQLYYQYKANEPLVLEHCSLELYRKDFLALLGGNGSGKTTLLKVIAGLLKQQRGSIRYKGERLKTGRKLSVHDSIGYLAQNPMLYFAHETVEEELSHAGAGIPNRDGRIQSLVQQFGLEHVLRQHPYDLSGGEKQKVALACVLLSEPDLILLDEPTKGLDPLAKERLGQLLRQLSLSGKTLLLVTHDVEFAAAYASRCALMFKGRVTAEGQPRDFFGDSLFYTTMINRVLRDQLPKAIMLEDVAFE